LDEAEDLIAKINQSDVEDRIHAAAAEVTRRQAIDAAAERDPDTRLNSYVQAARR